MLSLDLDAVRAAPGVVAVFTAADIPGENNVGPVVHDDRLLADGEILYPGQPLFLVAATSTRAARRAARLGKAVVEPRPALVTIADAKAAGSEIEATQIMARGDADAALAAAPHRLTGTLEMGGQEHFYLEGQAALATPGEQGQLHILSSTQHPSEIQHLVAQAARAQPCRRHRRGPPHGRRVRRQGDPGRRLRRRLRAGRGEDRPARQVPRRPRRRHGRRPASGTISPRITMSASTATAGSRRSASPSPRAAAPPSDLSPAINDRAMFHADNCYYLPAVEIVSHRLKTHTVSNTAFRGFGGPQGMMAIERVMDAIAAQLGRDPLEVRRANLYGPGRDVTPYHMTVEDNVAPELIAELAERAGYAARRAAVEAFNAGHNVLKKGLALTPVKFGISFTTTHLNQAGALVLVYADGSIHLNHGGTEMGQGLMIKVAQVVADVFGRADRGGEGHGDAHRQGPQHLGHRRLVGLRPERHGRAATPR